MIEDDQARNVSTYTERVRAIVADKKAEEERKRLEALRLQQEAKNRAYQHSFEHFKDQMRQKQKLDSFVARPDFLQQEFKKQKYAGYMQRVHGFNVNSQKMVDIQQSILSKEHSPKQTDFKPLFMKRRINGPTPEPEKKPTIPSDTEEEQTTLDINTY